MKPKTIALMVVAGVCGLGASIMTSRILAERSNQPSGEVKVKVLKAKTKVPAFQVLKGQTGPLDVPGNPIADGSTRLSVLPTEPPTEGEEVHGREPPGEKSRGEKTRDSRRCL